MSVINYITNKFKNDGMIQSFKDDHGKWSEKKLTKFYIVQCMMILTMIDFFINTKEGLRFDILGLWLAYAFGNTWAISQDKKTDAKNSNNSSTKKEEEKPEPDV